MSLRTTVSEVAVVGGEPCERPSCLLVDERASRSARSRRRGNLYVLVEVTGPGLGRDLMARQLLEIVRTAYFAWQGSVTAGLQQAIHEVNDWILAENRDSLPGDQRTAGVSCAVLRDDDLFIAQAGPAAVYLAHAGNVTRFPDVSPWLDGAQLDDADVAPLGARREVNVALYHTQVASGDVVLLVESSFVCDHSPRELPILLSTVPAEQLPAAITTVARGGDVSALVVAVGGESASEAWSYPSPPVQYSLADQPDEEPTQERAASLIRQVPVQETLRKVGRGAGILLTGLGGGLLTLLKRMLPSQIGPQAPPRRPAAQARRVGGEAGRRPKEEPPVQPRTGSLRKILTGSALAIPVLVAVIVVVMLVRRNQSQRAELELLWTDAQDSWQKAEASGDRATERSYLQAAAGYLDDLLERRPDRAEAIDLQARVLARQDEIELVRRIERIHGLKTYSDGSKLTRVVLQGFDIYVLDENSGQVFHHVLDATGETLKAGTSDTVVLKRGDAIGGVVVGDLLDMAWVPAGEGRLGGLVILESNGYLVDYTPTTGRLISFRPAGAASWQFPQLVSGRTPGRLYVLDPAPDKIWRYQSTADGLTAPPVDWLTSAVDLGGVIDMAVGDSIYLVYADGTIRRLSAGAPDTFDVSDWISLPSNPGAIVARPLEEAKSIYVADRGNARIVQASPEGRFERQLKLDKSVTQGSGLLSSISSLAADEIGGQVLFTSGSTLYLFRLPQ